MAFSCQAAQSCPADEVHADEAHEQEVAIAGYKAHKMTLMLDV